MSIIWKDGDWVVEGDLPNGLQILNGVWRARDGSMAPDCFGVLWDGLNQESLDCKGSCDFTLPCMELTAKQCLPATQIRLGPGHRLHELAAELDISEETVLALMAYYMGGNSPLVTKRKKVIEPDSKPVEILQLTAPPIKKQKVKRAKKSKKNLPDETMAVSPAKDPTQAQSVKRVKAGVKVKAVKTARLAKARAEITPTKHWGQHTFRQRWERERKRSPLIQKLKPGMKLLTTYKKQTCQAKVLEMGYKVNGKIYPTLYMAAIPFVGVESRPRQSQKGQRPEGTRRVSDYSAVKFWKLQKLLGKVKSKKKSVTKIAVGLPIPNQAQGAPPPLPWVVKPDF